MDITFGLPHVFYPDASPVENALALEASLDYLVNLNLAYLRFHPAAPLYRSGVRYGRTTKWLSIPELYADKRGDCKSLSCALVAEYILNKVWCKPVFRYIKRPDNSGLLDFHILVQVNTGFEDPSKRLGMPHKEADKFYGSGKGVMGFDGSSFHYI